MSAPRRSKLKPHQQEILNAMLDRREAARRELGRINVMLDTMIAFASPFTEGTLDVDSMNYVRPDEEE